MPVATCSVVCAPPVSGAALGKRSWMSARRAATEVGIGAKKLYRIKSESKKESTFFTSIKRLSQKCDLLLPKVGVLICGSHIYRPTMLTPELKKGSAEFLILSLLEAEPRHGYELSKLIESRSRGALTFHVASLYPLLYRMEERGWIAGRWVEKAGQRRRRYYTITDIGRTTLDAQRRSWREFVEAITSITGLRHA